jgi:hypothetical protein
MFLGNEWTGQTQVRSLQTHTNFPLLLLPLSRLSNYPLLPTMQHSLRKKKQKEKRKQHEKKDTNNKNSCTLSLLLPWSIQFCQASSISLVLSFHRRPFRSFLVCPSFRPQEVAIVAPARRDWKLRSAVMRASVVCQLFPLLVLKIKTVIHVCLQTAL